MSFIHASMRNTNANAAFAQNKALDQDSDSPACVMHITPTLSVMRIPMNASNSFELVRR